MSEPSKAASEVYRNLLGMSKFRKSLEDKIEMNKMKVQIAELEIQMKGTRELIKKRKLSLPSIRAVSLH